MTSIRYAVLAVSSAIAFGPPAQAADPIEVIAPFNLTGAASVLDVASYNGSALAIELINKGGGIDGREVVLVAVDTETDENLIGQKVGDALSAHPDAVAGIGYSYSTEALDAGKLFQAAGLPFISPGATDPAVPAEVGDMMFYAAYGDDAQAAAMALFVHEKLGLDTVAVWIDERRTYTRTIGRFFLESFKNLGGTVALAQSDKDPAGFADFLTKVKTVTPAPKAVYAATFPSDGPDMIKMARAAGVDLPLLSADGWDEEGVAAASKAEDLDGIYFTTHRFIGVDTPAMSAFIDDYTKKYGEAPPSAFAPLGFDSVNLLADAIRRAGSTDPQAIRAALAATTDFEGVVGKIAYTPGDRVPKKPVAVIAVDDGSESLQWVVTPD